MENLHQSPRAFPVLESIAPVVEHSRWVAFHPASADLCIERWGHLLDSVPTWKQPWHFFDGGLETVRWVFVLDVLNHCFWPDEDEPLWSVTYRGNEYSGYAGLAASLKRAMESGVPVTNASFLAGLSPGTLREILAGTGEIPLLDARLENLREAGRVLLARWEGDIVNLVASAGRSAVDVVKGVVDSFSSFRDECRYRGRPVYFWKRAQLFAADLHSAFDGRDWGAFEDIERLTAFADYKLPQVLRRFGLIGYHPELARRIERRERLPAGSEEEVEIRAATVWAVEALKKAFERRGAEPTSMRVDGWLWQLGQLEYFRKHPYHRCRTIHY